MVSHCISHMCLLSEVSPEAGALNTHPVQLFLTLLCGRCGYHPHFADEDMEAILPFSFLSCNPLTFPGDPSHLLPGGAGMSGYHQAWEAHWARMFSWVGRRGRLG